MTPFSQKSALETGSSNYNKYALAGKINNEKAGALLSQYSALVFSYKNKEM
jgi:hypothetical protein